jgi:protein involved in polysaccharide export with SLBB domain
MSIFQPFVRRAAIVLVLAAPLLSIPVRPAEAQGTARRPVGQDAASIRQQIQASGMSPEQIRARLLSKGLSPNVLDSYFTGVGGGTDISPSADVLAAVSVLTETDQIALDAATATVRSAAVVSAPTTRDGLPVFGLQIFRNMTNQFQPNLAGPVDATYKLGALDVVGIIATGQVELSYALEVTRDGFIVIPNVGQVYVANLPLDAATQAIVQRMRNSYAGAGTGTGSPTRVYVTVSRLRTNQVFVLGDVVVPGSYQVSAAGSALTALYAAGGPTVIGSMRSIKVMRGRDSTFTFDAYEYLLRGDASKDIRLQNGDRVFVPPVARYVSIVGEVLRPGVYELVNGETLAELVSTAGGFTPLAARSRVQISRILPPAERSSPGGRDRTVFDVTGPEFARGSAPRRELLTGDKVTVYGITSPERDKVMIAGNVWAGGQVGYRKGIRLSEVIRTAGGLKPDTYLDEVQIVRLLPDGTHSVLRPKLLDTLGRAEPDIELQDADDIHIFSQSEFRPERYVTVGGAVNRPGKVPFSTGLTLRQAILNANGLQESAYLTEVEIARMPVDRKLGQRAQIFRAPIDSTYLFERGPDGKYLGPPGVSVRASGTPEVELKPYDQVNVLRQTDWEVLPASVSVAGEVKFPGSYTIAKRDERITDVLTRAGGLTDRAYPDAFIYRRLIRPEEAANRKRVLDFTVQDQSYAIAAERAQVTTAQAGQAGAATTGTDVASVQAALVRALQIGPEPYEDIAVDLKRIIEDPSRSDNFRLYPGDQIIVGSFRAIVTVKGFVNAPISVPYVDGASLAAYVEAAGGVTRNGDLGRAFVQQPNGAVESNKKHPRPRAGAIIVVPAKDIKPDRPSNTPWTAVLATFASIATAAAAIIAVSK